MSRTPEVIVNKTAVKIQEFFYGGGVIAGLISVGTFYNGETGAGFLAALITGGLFFIGSKIKTHYHKTAEAAKYR